MLTILQYGDEITKEDIYQMQTWKENKNKIIQILSEKSLSFKEIIMATGLSRAVVNNHLKSLEADGLIKKEYVSGKLLNVLQASKLDLVEWFLDKLASDGVPKEVVEKGKTVLDRAVVAYSAAIYFRTCENMRKIVGRTAAGKLLESIDPFLSSKTKTPDFKITVTTNKQPWPKETQEYFNSLLSELNPNSFNVVMTVYSSEKDLYEVAPELLEKESDKFLFQLMPNDLKEHFDKTLDWWFEDVVDYLPSSGLFLFLTAIYMDSLLRVLGYKRALRKVHFLKKNI